MFEIKSDLTHFMPLIFFDTPWKPSGFPMFPGGIKKK